MAAPISGVLVLAGGRSRRLGRSKAWLDWNGRPLLLHVLDRLGAVAGGTIVVAARPGQRLPDGSYQRLDDRVPEAGPLAGIVRGLDWFADVDPETRVAVVACDYAHVDAALLSYLAKTEAGIVVPRWDGRMHPLQSVWRADLASICSDLLERGVRRVRDVVAAVDHRVVDRFPPGIDVGRALLNINDPEDLRAARGEA